MEQLLIGLLVVVSLLLSIQAAYTLYMMLYTWDQPEVDDLARVPEHLAAPSLSFTAVVPARHEEEVIAKTLDRVVRSNYPAALMQVIVVCSADDAGTIARTRQKIAELAAEGITNAELVIFDDLPINKPHGLNRALREAHSDVVTVFDAEDEIHPDIVSVVNTVMVNEGVKVVQAGVQLMNYKSNWYSTFNVLEYFFWFKSRLHYQARLGSMPLGGNTVFFNRELLDQLHGWDETNLTEDAEIGLRVSSMGERIRVIYDDRYVTKEETPPTLSQFIKQRTRWSQGFMQTLRSGVWKQMPTRRQRALAFYTLAFPHAQAMLGLYMPIAFAMVFVVHTPVLVAMLSFLPVLFLVAHFLTAVVGLYEFADAHQLKATPATVVKMAFTWLPYQIVLSYAALRALRRQMAGRREWEKTQHVGAHRVDTDKAVHDTAEDAARDVA
jgi:cellulose synthase/poly-beta-1,6-N-acetylglucosamine synthase-like glycosyltransferase